MIVVVFILMSALRNNILFYCSAHKTVTKSQSYIIWFISLYICLGRICHWLLYRYVCILPAVIWNCPSFVSTCRIIGVGGWCFSPEVIVRNHIAQSITRQHRDTGQPSTHTIIPKGNLERLVQLTIWRSCSAWREPTHVPGEPGNSMQNNLELPTAPLHHPGCNSVLLW